MAKPPSESKDSKELSQRDRFKRAAKEAGADDPKAPERFQKALARLLPSKTKPHQ